MKTSVETEDQRRAPLRPPGSRRRPEGATTAGPAPATPQARPRPVTPSVLKRLATARSGPGLVVSLYVNLDPSSFAVPAARETEIQAVVNAARADARRVWSQLDHDARQAVEGDLERAHRFLLTKLTPGAARAVAVFASTPRGAFEVFALGHTTPAMGRAGRQPYLRPLFEPAQRPDFAVLAIDRRWAHLMVSRAGAPLQAVAEIESRTRGHRERSGAEQARVQRVVDHDTDQHVKKAVERLFRLHQARPIGALVLACGREIHPVVERHLHPDLAAVLLGRVPWDPEQDDLARLARAAEPLLQGREERLEHEYLDRLELEVGRGTGAVGVSAVIHALNQKAVDTLLLEPGVEVSGADCPVCGWLAARPGVCPACAHLLDTQPDLLEPILRRAIGQSADVVFLHFSPPHRREPAHMAAVLRPGVR